MRIYPFMTSYDSVPYTRVHKKKYDYYKIWNKRKSDNSYQRSWHFCYIQKSPWFQKLRHLNNWSIASLKKICKIWEENFSTLHEQINTFFLHFSGDISTNEMNRRRLWIRRWYSRNFFSADYRVFSSRCTQQGLSKDYVCNNPILTGWEGNSRKYKPEHREDLY